MWDTSYHRYFLAKLKAELFTIVFVDEKHEDFDLLYTYPVIEWNRGKAHKIIYRLMCGQHFVIEVKSFFTMGGVYSVDQWRAKAGGNRNCLITRNARLLKKHLNYVVIKVDYVLTYTVSDPILQFRSQFA